ncbi:MAG: histidinol-phosphatase [Erysipelotrichaceae bacterium]
MKEQNFNYHTHTYRCGHATGEDEQYIKAAIMAGFKTIGMSDHMGYPQKDVPSDRMSYEMIGEYLNSMYLLKEKYKDQINILVGFEIEWYDNCRNYLIDMRKQCDYMIIGQHCKYVDGYGYDYLCNDEDVSMYATQIETAFASGLISILAHPDYFMLGRRDFNDACVEASKRIAQASLTYDIPLEVNLKGMKKSNLFYDDGQHPPYPNRKFWEIVSSYGCKVVYGFDAHCPADLLESSRIKVANKILEGLELNYVDEVKIR